MAASRLSRLASVAVIALMIVTGPSTVSWAGAPTTSDDGVAISVIAAIDAAVAAGELTEAEGLLNKVRFVTGSGTLPKRFEPAGKERIKCGTGILVEAREKFSSLPEEISREILALAARPVTTSHLDTQHFRIHYDTSGPNTIHGWPGTGYRDSVAAACEAAWKFYHVANSWQIPPADGGGGNSLIDCYVTDAGGAYGWTQPEAEASRWPGDWTAFFVVDHAYDAPFQYADRTLPLRVTVAHEYHHVVQMDTPWPTTGGWRTFRRSWKTRSTTRLTTTTRTSLDT